MVDLDSEIYSEILELSNAGNAHMDSGEYHLAQQCFELALKKLPFPAEAWEAYVWLMAGLIDALYHIKNYGRALCEIEEVIKKTDEKLNSFLILRLGQCLYEKGQPESVGYLCEAYIREGEEIFSEENIKFFRVVKDELHISD